MPSGRKTLKEEMAVLERFNQLAPKVFAYLTKCLASEDKTEQRWAMDWLKAGYAKMIPQKIGGDPDNQTPIPLLYVLHNDSSKKDSHTDKTDSGSTGGNVSLKDSIDSLIPD